MKNIFTIVVIATMLTGISCNRGAKKTDSKSQSMSSISKETQQAVIKQLTDSFPNEKMRINKGVEQVAALWTEKDGTQDDFKTFCISNFASSEIRERLFNKLSVYFEVLWGNMNKISIGLKQYLHLDMGPIEPVDEMFGGYSASAHLGDDFFRNKIAFLTILNFPYFNLKEKTEYGPKWSRQEWAYARMGDVFKSRVPAELYQKASETLTAADTYISEYNIWMGKLVDDKGQKLFPDDMKLITHWGLRDEIKSQYAKPDGLEKQKMIYQVMKHIIDQSIPSVVINKGDVNWNPFSNKIFKNGKEESFTPEDNVRYQTLLNNFHVMKELDVYNPNNPTAIQRAFEEDMEISQADIEKLFTDFISSPLMKKTGDLISKRLGRPLQPFDIWYDGFKARSGINQDELDKKVSAKYPSRETFQAGLPGILTKLGWTNEKAKEISSRIQVDGSRGAGHAWGAEMRDDKARLRTRIGEKGMNYKGYNIAMHEFGHCVEQTISLYDVDFYIMKGVPNTAFTEALAFIFQKRDLANLDIKETNPMKEHLAALDNLWMSYEIMGVALVDMKVWKWMYENPNATAPQLKEAVINIAKETWNTYYAPVFGIKDEPILAIYSHMIDNPLYLSNYPLGHLIEFQIESYIKDRKFSDEVMRMFTTGRLIPQMWMKNAVGSEISIQPSLKAAEQALEVL